MTPQIFSIYKTKFKKSRIKCGIKQLDKIDKINKIVICVCQEQQKKHNQNQKKTGLDPICRLKTKQDQFNDV